MAPPDGLIGLRGPFTGFDTGAGGLVCGGGGAGFGCGVNCCAAAGAAVGAIAEMPAASNSRNFCARVVAAAEDVVATGTADDVVACAPSGSGSKIACGAVEAEAAEAVAIVDGAAADSDAVFTVYVRTRTINAVAKATVSSVRKTDRNEIWTRRRTDDLSVDNARNSESERLDFRPERFAVRNLHHVTALHRSHRRP